MLSLTIVVLLTSDLSILDVKDDAMVCLCTALSFTPSYGTPLALGLGLHLVWDAVMVRTAWYKRVRRVIALSTYYKTTISRRGIHLGYQAPLGRRP